MDAASAASSYPPGVNALRCPFRRLLLLVGGLVATDYHSHDGRRLLSRVLVVATTVVVLRRQLPPDNEVQTTVEAAVSRESTCVAWNAKRPRQSIARRWVRQDT